MINSFFQCVAEWAKQDKYIISVLLVGSYAHGTNTVNSDIDLVIVSTNKLNMLNNTNFIEQFGSVISKQIEYYGNCTSIRVWFTNGLEVEFGIVEPSWLDLPLDKGTKKVLDDGYKIIIDKQDLLKKL